MIYRALFEIAVSFIPVLALLVVFLTITHNRLIQAELNWRNGMTYTETKINAIFWAICGTALVSPFIMGAYAFIVKPYLLG